MMWQSAETTPWVAPEVQVEREAPAEPGPRPEAQVAPSAARMALPEVQEALPEVREAPRAEPAPEPGPRPEQQEALSEVRAESGRLPMWEPRCRA